VTTLLSMLFELSYLLLNIIIITKLTI